jgi:hypothetical protein
MRERIVTPVLVGVLLGEFVFIALFSPGEDFWQHYYAGHTIRGGVAVEEAMAGRVPPGWHYPYPMFTAVLLLPLSFLPPSVSFRLWAVLLYVTLGLGIYAVARRVAVLGREEALNGTLLCLAWPVTFCAVFIGQITPILLSLFVTASLLVSARKSYAAGLVLSLALCKPHFALPVFGAFALRRQWRVITALGLGAIVLVGMSLVFGQNTAPDAWRQYVVSWFLARRTVSLVGLLQPLTPGWRLLATVLGFCMIGVWWLRKQVIGPVDAAWGVLASLLVSPYVPVYDLVLLAPVVVLLVRRRGVFFWSAIVLSSLSALRFGFSWAALMALGSFGAALLRMSRNSTRRAGPIHN